MNEELKVIVLERIDKMGIKKSYLAKRMLITNVRFSQIMSGKRGIKPEELKLLKETLTIE